MGNKSKFFFVSSHKLIEVHKLDLEKNSVDLFATLVPSEFLISLAIEMMAKAYYLKHNPDQYGFIHIKFYHWSPILISLIYKLS